MFFTAENWKKADLNQIIPTSSALSYEKLASSLTAADDLFLLPLLGTELMNRAAAIMTAEDPSELEQTLLRWLRVAEANLALWYNFQELQLRFTDQGWQRQTTENFTSPYKYQEDQLRAGFKNKGMNALDTILQLLENHADTFTEFASCPAYTEKKSGRFVQTTEDVNRVYFINNSRLVFLRLRPVIREIEETILPYSIGERLFEVMQGKLKSKMKDEEIGNTTVEEFRLRCVDYIVMKAIAQLVRQTGSLTDRGLYFENVGKAGESGDEQTAAGSARAAALASNAELSAQTYLNRLHTFISCNLENYFGGRESDLHQRDNEGKQSVWL